MYDTATCNVEKIKTDFQNELAKPLSTLHRLRGYNSNRITSKAVQFKLIYLTSLCKCLTFIHSC